MSIWVKVDRFVDSFPKLNIAYIQLDKVDKAD